MPLLREQSEGLRTARPRMQGGTSQKYNDEPVAEGDSLTVIKCIKEYREEAWRARRTRIDNNRLNMECYLGRQDFSNKIRGQSTEFLPKTSLAVEQLSSFVKKSLIAFGDWFSVDIQDSLKQALPITEQNIQDLIKHFLDHIPAGHGKFAKFATIMSDATKLASLEALYILKVYGAPVKERRFVVEQGEPIFDPGTGTSLAQPTVVSKELDVWRLCVDLVRSDDYYPDPSGEGLYEIHRSERDLHYLADRAASGMYDAEVVAGIIEDYTRSEYERRREYMRNQDRTVKPSFRKKVVIDEFWGTLLDTDGRVVHRNVVATIADDKYLIRKPQANPFWHGESPFVVAPLVRVPFSVWHKAVYDHAASLNLALNELFNLMLDGGIASVWGTRQLRRDKLVNPDEVASGIPQGKTLEVTDDLGVGEKVLEVVATGTVPPDAMGMFNQLSSEFTAAALSNELKIGQFPQKQVLATEIVSQNQAQSAVLDAISGEIEKNVIEQVIRKGWMCILQSSNALFQDDVVGIIGQAAAFQLMNMPPAMRFQALAGGVGFSVYGLTATLDRAKEFQKFAALMQMCGSNPIMLRAFIMKFSAERAITSMMKALNINPEHIMKTPEEMAKAQQEMNQVQALGGGGKNAAGSPAGVSPNTTGDQGLPAEINQAGNPLTGMAAVG